MRKFLTEHVVNIYSARWLLLPSSQLMSDGEMPAAEAEISENCHIYLICKHPATSFDPADFAFDGDTVSGHVNYRVQGTLHRLPFRFRFPLLDDAVALELSPYPHREFRTLDSSGKIVRYVTASAVCFGNPARLDTEHLGRFEVMYVGQAYAEGRRTARDRLRSHATLQRILADSHYSDPDAEIFVFTFEYLPYRLITQMDGMARGVIDDERDSQRFVSIRSNPLTTHQQICLVEAALIKYFSPRFNEIYKESFPSESHKILRECYKLDIGGLVIEINTDELRFCLFSAATTSKMHHIAKVDLFDSTERLGFFHMSDGTGGFHEMPNVIRRA